MTQRSFPRPFSASPSSAHSWADATSSTTRSFPLTINTAVTLAPVVRRCSRMAPSTCCWRTSPPTNAATVRLPAPLPNSWPRTMTGLVHPLAIHAGSLAAVSSAPSTRTGPTPRPTPSGTSWPSQVNPIGRINRRGGPRRSSPNNWPALVDGGIGPDPGRPPAGRRDPRPHRVRRCPPAHPHHLRQRRARRRPAALLINENSLIAAQLDYQSDPQVIEDFEHNHLLRGSLNGADGLVVASDPGAGSTVQLDYTLVWNDEWVLDNSHVLAVLTNANGEVLNCLDLPWTP